jgi:hypothetical protein
MKLEMEGALKVAESAFLYGRRVLDHVMAANSSIVHLCILLS